MVFRNRVISVFVVLACLPALILSDVKGKVVVESRAKAIEQEREAYANIMAAYMNTKVDPCDDFYEYSCGNYFKVHKFKHGSGTTDVFDIATDERNEALHNILSEPVNSNNITVREKAKLFYQSCMRVDIFDYPKSETYLKMINSLGGWPVLETQWSPKQFDWFNITAELASYGIDLFLAVHQGEEPLKFSVNHIGFRELLFDRPFSREYNMNRGIVMKILDMYGVPSKNSKKIFKEILQLSKEWLKFVKRCYRKKANEETLTIDDLQNKVPEIDWDRYMFALFGKEVHSSMEITLAQKKCLKRLPKFFTSKNAKSIATYTFLKFLFELHKEFNYPKYPRDFCISKVNYLMGDVMTAMYIYSNYHQEIVEDEVTSMASYMRSAFKDIIKDNHWMDRETKRKALTKLRDMRMVIGDVEFSLDFQVLEKDYRDLQIGVDSDFYESNLALTQRKVRKEYNAYLEEEDEDEPDKYESDVNAYYSPTQNKIILPAGILRKPFFNQDLPKSYNFGAMGANIIGHEMTHGFDSSGRYYDADGDEADWWTDKSDVAFEERAQCFVETYNAYKIIETRTNVEGNITLPENIADSGGVRQGYFAYKKWLNANSGYFDIKKEVLPQLNLTNTQLFFLAYAQSYCGKYKRGGYQALEGDEHAVNKFRVIGSVSNFDKFGEEFNCALGTTMNPKRKCVIW